MNTLFLSSSFSLTTHFKAASIFLKLVYAVDVGCWHLINLNIPIVRRMIHQCASLTILSSHWHLQFTWYLYYSTTSSLKLHTFAQWLGDVHSALEGMFNLIYGRCAMCLSIFLNLQGIPLCIILLCYNDTWITVVTLDPDRGEHRLFMGLRWQHNWGVNIEG